MYEREREREREVYKGQAHVRISGLVQFFKVIPLSIHALGHPFKPRDHGVRPC